MSLQTYSASDYAIIEGPKMKAYYGHEETAQIPGGDPDDTEWCFVVWKGGKEVFRKTNSELLPFAAEESPLGMLVAGLAMYINK